MLAGCFVGFFVRLGPGFRSWWAHEGLGFVG
jgi:hypothetical protein